MFSDHSGIKLELRVPIMVQQVKDLVLFLLWLVIHPWPSGLRIQCCHSCDLGHNCGLYLIPGAGTFICCRCGQKEKKKENLNSVIENNRKIFNTWKWNSVFLNKAWVNTGSAKKYFLKTCNWNFTGNPTYQNLWSTVNQCREGNIQC